MREKEPQFTVTDRRKFTAEGELRDGESGVKSPESAGPYVVKPAAVPAPPANEPANLTPAAVGDPAGDEMHDEMDRAPGALPEDDLIPEPTAAEWSQQLQDYAAISQLLDTMVMKANPGQEMPPAMNMEGLVQSLYMTAAMQMGAGASNDPNSQPRIDILGARQTIDMLQVLHEKTEGNLADAEKTMLSSVLFDLRMSFLEMATSIANAAQRSPQAGRHN